MHFIFSMWRLIGCVILVELCVSCCAGDTGMLRAYRRGFYPGKQQDSDYGAQPKSFFGYNNQHGQMPNKFGYPSYPALYLFGPNPMGQYSYHAYPVHVYRKPERSVYQHEADLQPKQEPVEMTVEEEAENVKEAVEKPKQEMKETTHSAGVLMRNQIVEEMKKRQEQQLKYQKEQLEYQRQMMEEIDMKQREEEEEKEQLLFQQRYTVPDSEKREEEQMWKQQRLLEEQQKVSNKNDMERRIEAYRKKQEMLLEEQREMLKQIEEKAEKNLVNEYKIQEEVLKEEEERNENNKAMEHETVHTYALPVQMTMTLPKAETKPVEYPRPRTRIHIHEDSTDSESTESDSESEEEGGENKGLVFNGEYSESCEKDGLFYRDEKSYIICINGLAIVQPCAPGTENKPMTTYTTGAEYKRFDFCSINLVARGNYGAAANNKPSADNETDADALNAKVKNYFEEHYGVY